MFSQTSQRLQGSMDVWNSMSNFSESLTPPPEETVHEFLANDFDLAPLSPVDPSEPPVVAVIGVGYVGLHLVTTFASKFRVVAYDVSEKRLQSLSGDMAAYPSVTLTAAPADLACATHFLVSVPTTLLPDKQIDTSYVRSALSTVSAYARPGATVVIESSVAVGMTRQLLQPLMQTRSLKAGMSPERVDPGRVEPAVHAIPKIISGLDDITPGSLAAIQALYSQVFANVVVVSSPEVAEMTKLYENCQRMMCIAYANEMADACAQIGIDAFEVSRAAATKPFGYMPFNPSLGVGGHCIPVNPYYLLASSEFPLLQAATERMWSRPARLADEAMRALHKDQRRRKDSLTAGELDDRYHWPRVLVVGAGFKPGQAVLSYSPGVALVKHLQQEWNANVTFADPLVEQDALPFVPKMDTETEWNAQGLNKYDLIFVAIRQHGLDFDVLADLEGVEVKFHCI